MEIKMNLTLDEMEIISAALNNDALVYIEYAKEHWDDKKFFEENMDCYREIMLLKNKFDNLWEDNQYKIMD